MDGPESHPCEQGQGTYHEPQVLTLSWTNGVDWPMSCVCSHCRGSGSPLQTDSQFPNVDIRIDFKDLVIMYVKLLHACSACGGQKKARLP